MSESEQARQYFYDGTPCFGGIICFAASTSAVTVDVTGIAGWPGNQVNGADVSVTGGKNSNPVGHMISLQADGGDVYVAFGDSVAHLGSVSNTAVTAVSNNEPATAYTANGCVKIPNGTTVRYKLPLGSNPANQATWGANSPARYLCFLTGTGTATLRAWQSSP